MTYGISPLHRNGLKCAVINKCCLLIADRRKKNKESNSITKDRLPKVNWRKSSEVMLSRKGNNFQQWKSGTGKRGKNSMSNTCHCCWLLKIFNGSSLFPSGKDQSFKPGNTPSSINLHLCKWGNHYIHPGLNVVDVKTIGVKHV